MKGESDPPPCTCDYYNPNPTPTPAPTPSPTETLTPTQSPTATPTPTPVPTPSPCDELKEHEDDYNWIREKFIKDYLGINTFSIGTEYSAGHIAIDISTSNGTLIENPFDNKKIHWWDTGDHIYDSNEDGSITKEDNLEYVGDQANSERIVPGGSDPGTETEWENAYYDDAGNHKKGPGWWGYGRFARQYYEMNINGYTYEFGFRWCHMSRTTQTYDMGEDNQKNNADVEYIGVVNNSGFSIGSHIHLAVYLGIDGDVLDVIKPEEFMKTFLFKKICGEDKEIEI